MTVNNGFFVVDDQWTVQFWNRGAEILLGVDAERIIGKNFWHEFSSEIPGNFHSICHKGNIHNVPVHIKQYWRGLGAWFDVVTYYDDGTLFVSFKRADIPQNGGDSGTDLHARNELYRYVTEITNDCLWEWDLNAHEHFWIDGGHKKLFGYDIVNATVSQSFWESRLHPDDKAYVLKGLLRIIASGSPCRWEEEYRFKKASGEYAFVHDRGHIIYQEEKAVRLVGATQDVSARKLLEKQLSKERLTRHKDLADAVLTAQESERSAIGAELHDNLNQILGASKMYIEIAKVDEECRSECLEKASGYIVDVIESIRKISKSLAAPGMVMDLLESIEILVEDLAIIHPIKIELQASGIDSGGLDKKLLLDIFRIVQEQMNNIVKHARATNAIINLSKQANTIVLLISDNGQGYDMQERKKGVGIININNRAALHQGSVSIWSKPGEGYKLEVVLAIAASSAS
jgi:PAS domain S-box-containing protein